MVVIYVFVWVVKLSCVSCEFVFVNWIHPDARSYVVYVPCHFFFVVDGATWGGVSVRPGRKLKIGAGKLISSSLLLSTLVVFQCQEERRRVNNNNHNSPCTIEGRSCTLRQGGDLRTHYCIIHKWFNHQSWTMANALSNKYDNDSFDQNDNH